MTTPKEPLVPNATLADAVRLGMPKLAARRRASIRKEIDHLEGLARCFDEDGDGGSASDVLGEVARLRAELEVK